LTLVFNAKGGMTMGICNVSLTGSGGVHRFESEVGPFESRLAAAGWLREEGFKPYRDGWLKVGDGIVLVYAYDADSVAEYRSGPMRRIFAKINLQYDPKFISFKRTRR
jgi:hypothetical protein